MTSARIASEDAPRPRFHGARHVVPAIDIHAQGERMGIYDRPYIREEERSLPWGGGRSLVVNLIIINVVVWLAGVIFEEQQLNSRWLAVNSDLFSRPWMCWQLITYGFAHHGLMHILFNMFFLWFFGRELEDIYGRAEFLRLYLVAIAFSGLAWVAMATISGENSQLVGASGGVMALMMLYVLHFPRRVLLVWGIIPTPAWVLGIIFVAMDLLGFANSASGAQQEGPQVANIAHLAGALFGFVYFRTGLNLGRLVPRRLTDLKGPLLGPKLRIHDPEREARDLSRQVDAILEKISREGESSLSRKERRTLEEASRRYQRKRQ